MRITDAVRVSSENSRPTGIAAAAAGAERSLDAARTSACAATDATNGWPIPRSFVATKGPLGFVS